MNGGVTLTRVDTAYSASWSVPPDASGISKYAYKWFRTGDVIHLPSMTVTTSTSVSGSMPAAAGTYRFVIMAMDKMGHWSDTAGTYESSEVTVVPPDYPTVSITSPINNATVSGNVMVTASVTGADTVKFYLDGHLRSTSGSPFTWTWDTTTVAEGTHTLQLICASGGTDLAQSEQISVNVQNTTPPADADQYEPNGSSLTATSIRQNTQITARISSATDADWYSFTVTGTGQIAAYLTVPEGTNYQLELYGPEATWVAGSYNDLGVSESITYMALAPGNYWIRVYGLNGSFSTSQPYWLDYSIATAQFQGTVRNNGSPISGVHVYTESQTNGWEMHTTTTDSDGNFSIPVNAGQWTFFLVFYNLDPNTNNLVVPSGFTKSIASGETVSGVDFNVLSGTGTISGSVMNGTGAIISGVTVSASATINGINYNASATTDDTGHYSFPVVNAIWTVSVLNSGTNFFPKSISVAGSATLDLVPPAVTAHVTGRVLKDGLAVSGITVQASYSGGSGLDTKEAVTDQNGNFDIGVYPGRWNVFIPEQSSLVIPSSTPFVTIFDGETLAVGDLSNFAATGTVSGTVKDSNALPLSGWLVNASARVNGVDVQMNARTNETGLYSLPVVDGAWDVWVQNYSGYSVGRVTVTGSATLDFVPFTATAHVQGHVTRNGSPFPGAIVSVYQSGWRSFAYGQPDADGNFNIGVPSGTWDISFGLGPMDDYDYWVFTQPPRIQLTDGQTVSGLALSAKSATGTISGSVKDAANNPVIGIDVTGTCTSGGLLYSITRTTGNDGTFRLPAFDGDWTVDVIEKSGDVFGPQTMTVSGTSVVNFAPRQSAHPTISTRSTLPSGTVGAGYSQTLTATGGTMPYTWALVSGSLPAQLALSPGGVISGKPSSATTANFTIRVTGNDTLSSTANFTLKITSPYTTWHGSQFTAPDMATGSTTLTADFDHDGMANLLEYAFGKNPKAADAADIAPNVCDNKLQIAFTCDATRTDITYTVQVSSTLAGNSWTDIAKSVGGGMTDPVGSLSTVSDTGTGLRTVTVTDSTAIPSGKRFLRVKVTSP